MEFTQHPGSDDTDDADVPGGISLHDDQIALRIEAVPYAFSSLLGDTFLDLLTFAILQVEHFGQTLGFGLTVAEQQPQCVLCGFQASGGVETRSELETDLIDSHRAACPRNPLERLQSQSRSAVEAL